MLYLSQFSTQRKNFERISYVKGGVASYGKRQKRSVYP